MNQAEIAASFTSQLCIILLVCLVMGRMVKLIGQPPVIGEMLAGICLGPSLFGALAPQLQAAVFPKDGATMSILYTLSQIGLVLYMFVVGLEFDTRQLRQHARTASTISLAGLLTPLGLGTVLALYLSRQDGVFFTAGVSAAQAALFLGAAIATTAFPMLARIIAERGIAGTRLGTLALASGAATDAISWVLLATVVAVFHNDPKIVALALGGGVLYTAFLATVGRRLLDRFLRVAPSHEGHGTMNPSTLALVIILVLTAGWYTNAVGIHSIFGGFLLGVVMPKGRIAEQLISWIEPMIKNLLLPLFFVYSGLNTELGLLNSPTLWLVSLLIIAASVLGKGVACYAAGRIGGMGNYEALALGALMNARGLIELILLNIGLQAHLITPTLFAVMVVMAIVTTLTTAPVFDFAMRRWTPPAPTPAATGIPAADPVSELVLTRRN